MATAILLIWILSAIISICFICIGIKIDTLLGTLLFILGNIIAIFWLAWSCQLIWYGANPWLNASK